MFVKNQEKIDKVIALFKENVKPAKVFTSLNSQGVTVSKSTVYSQWEIYSREGR
jgi:Fe2+ or Zn2+ uptake regulation protein